MINVYEIFFNIAEILELVDEICADSNYATQNKKIILNKKNNIK